MNNIFKLTTGVFLLYFFVNAATINVAKDSSISAAVKQSAANDTIVVAAGAFVDSLTIDKSLTIIGFHRDSTIIKRAEHDGSMPTITVKAKNVTIKNLTVFGHDAAKAADSADTMTCWPTSDAVLLSEAESTSIASCIFVGGYGIGARSIEAANGGSGLKIKKSNWIFLTNDSMQGGAAHVSYPYGDTIIDDSSAAQPLKLSGVSGAGIWIDTSSNIIADSIIIDGGKGYELNWQGEYTAAMPGLLCYRGKKVKVANSIFYGGVKMYMLGDTAEAFFIYDSSDLDTCNCQLFSDKGGWADETSYIIDCGKMGVLFHRAHAVNRKDVFSLRLSTNQSISLGCLVAKESFLAIDLLNAKGQTIKKLMTGHVAPGLQNYTFDLKSGGVMLSNSAYFLTVATNQHRRCFVLPSVR